MRSIFFLLQFLFAALLLAVPAFADDTDNDGLDDTWEMSSFGDLDQTAEGDPDQDRFPNAWEAAWDTNGSASASKPLWAASQTGPGYFKVDDGLAAASDFEKQTLQAAVDAAADFGILEIDPGNYEEEVVIPQGKRLFLFSTQGASVTRLVPIDEDTSILKLESNSIVEGLTFSGSGIEAIYVYQAPGFKLRNCVLTGNDTGIYLYGSGDQGISEIRNCTISKNDKGIFLDSWGGDSVCKILNSIVSDNQLKDVDSYYEEENTIEVSYTALGQKVDLDVIVPLGAGVMRIDPQATGSDPAILSSTGLTPDFHLRSDSPLINRGTVLQYNAPADMDGEPRLNIPANPPDPGCDEFVDSDSDELPDWWETLYPTAVDPVSDSDGDSISSLGEYLAAINPTLTDTDSDSLGDGWELANSHDPRTADLEEDTDKDGFPNRWEKQHGSNGADAAAMPTWNAVMSGPGYFRLEEGLAVETATQKSSLAAAVAAAGNIGVIEVRPGQYDQGTSTVVVPAGKRLLIFSSNGAGQSVLTGPGSVISMENDSIIDGLTLRSHADVAFTLQNAGTQDACIRNCLIIGTSSDFPAMKWVSSINFEGLRGAVIEQCTFLGGIYSSGIEQVSTLAASSLRVVNSAILGGTFGR